MATTYRIKSVLLAISQDCPPSLVFDIFPAYGEVNGWECTLSGEVCTVTAPAPQTPVDLGPLVKVETLSE
jgi:hypothetical protein